MASEESATLCWVADKSVDGEWHRARIVSQNEDGAVTLETIEAQEEVATTTDKLLLANELPDEGVEDMTRLNYLHEPALLNNLRHRFGRDHVYTYTGKICIAVNPFNWQVSQPLYLESVLTRYRGRDFGDLPPHVYAIAEDAYQHILAEGRNQSSVWTAALALARLARARTPRRAARVPPWLTRARRARASRAAQSSSPARAAPARPSRSRS